MGWLRGVWLLTAVYSNDDYVSIKQMLPVLILGRTYKPWNVYRHKTVPLEEVAWTQER